MIAPRNWIIADDRRAVYNFLELAGPLSGYLAGKPHGGAAVQRLEEMWCNKFGRRHAIAVNSATSGLLAACEAVGIGNRGHHPILVPALSMSATAAVPEYVGAALHFLDVDQYGCASFDSLEGWEIDTAIVTTVFGHPIDRRWAGFDGTLIIDNAQGILSGYDDGRSTERMGHIVVTSFNVHKQINAGEGGIISTDDPELAAEMQDFINHGESGGAERVGLNLRMTELSAVLALSQMARIDDTIQRLNDLCRALDELVILKGFKPLGVREGCNSARYCYAFSVADDWTAAPYDTLRAHRDNIVAYLCAEGVPAIPMYRPLYELPAFAQYTRPCPMAERLADGLVVFELCGWKYEDDLPAVARALEKAAKL